jgi:hypothetical protein
MDIITPSALAEHGFKNDGHFTPNPYPAGSAERAEFDQKIYDLYVKDFEESRAQLNSMFGDPLGDLDNMIRGLKCQ